MKDRLTSTRSTKQEKKELSVTSYFCRRAKNSVVTKNDFEHLMENICCICLESVLSGGAVGATSCGHCFHTECFEPWQRRGGGRDVKCPTCNSKVKLFHPLYLDFGAVLQLEASDDEDKSIDSQNEEETDEIGLNLAGEKRKRSAEPTEMIIPIDDEIAVVEMVEPLPAGKNQPESSATCNKEKFAKYKARAKRQGQTIKSLQKYVDELKQSDQDQQRLIEDLNSQIGKKEMDVNRLECENNIIRRRSEISELNLRSTQQQLEVVIAAKDQIEHQLQMLQAQHRKESSRSMTEVRRCIEERPKLLEEIKSLKAQLTRSAAPAPLPKQTGNVSKQKQLLNQLDLECQERKQIFAFPAPPRDVKKYSKRAHDMMKPKSGKTTANNPLISLSSLLPKKASTR